MRRLWVYLERTVVLQGVCVLLFVVAFCTHLILGHKMHLVLWLVLASSLGLWFGVFSQFNAHREEGG